MDVLPRCASSKRLRYEKQTEAPNPFRLLLVEVLHGGKVLENGEEGLFDDVPFNFMDSPNSALLQAGGIPKSEFRILNLDYPLSFRSEISLSPSAIRLKERTEKKMARPGKMESQEALVSWS